MKNYTLILDASDPLVQITLQTEQKFDKAPTMIDMIAWLKDLEEYNFPHRISTCYQLKLTLVTPSGQELTTVVDKYFEANLKLLLNKIK